ncbi:MAG: sigma-70 family RNA polymerase sigma factor [Actinomycetota bacterium]|nr:sigma-70 family RNA polymerase sigma factor [Actinomycetota bacterium]
MRVESFESFYSRAGHQVHRAVAVGTGNADLAADATEEAMVRAYERWEKVSVMANPEGWVYVVAMNWARNRLKRRRYRSNLPVPDVGQDDPQVPDPKLVATLRRLPVHQREVVVARYLLDMSEADMAKAFGVAKGTIKSRLHRGLEALRKDLS